MAEYEAPTDHAICQTLNIDLATWQRILNNDADARDLKIEAQAIQRDRLTQAVYQKAVGGDVESARLLLAQS